MNDWTVGKVEFPSQPSKWLPVPAPSSIFTASLADIDRLILRIDELEARVKVLEARR